MRDFRIGLGEKIGILYHDFFSIPMLLNSSELMFEMRRFAPARATNTSKQTETTRTNMDHTPFLIYLFNLVWFEKLYPLTVLLFMAFQLIRIYKRRCTKLFVPCRYTVILHYCCEVQSKQFKLTKTAFEIKFNPQPMLNIASRSGGIGRRATFRAW